MPRPQLLIVEDDPGQVQILQAALKDAPVEVQVTDGVAAALRVLSQQRFHAVLCDLVMPEGGGQAVLRFVRHQGLTTPVIIVTGYGDEESLTDCLAAGAFDFLSKPVERFTLCAVLRRALLRNGLFCEENFLGPARRSTSRFPTLVGTSPAMQDVYERMAKVAAVDATVCLGGESGTGKELVARLLHYWSDRVGSPFVPVNCKAFAEGVLESELFGHEKGAFTGAAAARVGCFERSAGGTLFLDEIGETSPDFQAKLLRVLQDGEVLPVGGSKTRPVDVRVVAATNRVLREEVAAGRFREDLYFRLNVIPILLAPLRDRREDILPLARHFLARHAAESGRQLAFAPESEQALLAHPWPGNVRELENAVERAVVLARSETITPEDLLLEQSPLSLPAAATEGTLQDVLDRAAAARIRAALDAAKGQRAEAARVLGVERTTLYRMMKRLGI
jgi:two-component system response regulator AtoC